MFPTWLLWTVGILAASMLAVSVLPLAAMGLAFVWAAWDSATRR